MRAVGRIVVCVDADADVSTEMISSVSKTLPNGELPKTVGPRALNTSLELSGLASPRLVSPTPANATVETETIA